MICNNHCNNIIIFLSFWNYIVYLFPPTSSPALPEALIENLLWVILKVMEGPPFFQAQKMFVDVPENTVILDEMTLRHMVQDCTVKTQLLKLERLLHQLVYREHFQLWYFELQRDWLYYFFKVKLSF